MNEKSNSKFISRRKFIKGVGSGVAGSYVLMPGMKNLGSGITKNIEELSEDAQTVSLKVNGKKVMLLVEPNTTLAELLRNDLELTGTKIVCNHGECGGCTVLLDGKAVYSCHMLAVDAEGKEVTTIEGLMSGEKLHPIQKAFIEHDGLQCGFCTPGQVMAAQALLLKNSKPTKEDIIDGMAGNICKCSAYPNIIKSVQTAAEKL